MEETEGTELAEGLLYQRYGRERPGIGKNLAKPVNGTRSSIGKFPTGKQPGRLPFDQNFQNFRNGDKWYENFQGKVPENPEIVINFRKLSEPFNRRFRKFRDESQMEWKFPGKIKSKIWVYLTRLSFFSEFMQIRNFLLSAS